MIASRQSLKAGGALVLAAMLVFGCGDRRRMPELYFEVHGSGTPTIVIDTGFGETFQTWEEIIPQLAQLSTVFVYERAGYGRSEPGHFPRHARRVAHDLHYCLTTNKVPGPYLLVGHSLGAMNLQVFAADYPDQVAGLLLLDPPPLAWLRGQGFPELRELANRQSWEMNQAALELLDSGDPRQQGEGLFYKTLASEHNEMLNISANIVSNIGSYGNLPLVLLAAGQPNPAFGEYAESFQQFWIEQSRLVAEKSTCGGFRLLTESGHHLQQEAPAAIVTALEQLLAEIRTRKNENTTSLD
ncbi:MAG: alpha/beta hydrolase [Candidatus Neomarinimicrobiota bacterium]